jgi:hypothetical protein
MEGTTTTTTTTTTQQLTVELAGQKQKNLCFVFKTCQIDCDFNKFLHNAAISKETIDLTIQVVSVIASPNQIYDDGTERNLRSKYNCFTKLQTYEQKIRSKFIHSALAPKIYSSSSIVE